ncbi:MAG: PucR family transcriptional regulator [Actinobacteria bacterium]|nr:PucR family transcriptional regulator [Actinomycetota bacterium]
MWDRPSDRVRDLIRQCARIVAEPRAEWLAELDRATTATNPAVTGDPILAAAISATNRANIVYWATANIRDPGAPVAANLGPEPLGIARDLVRRGMDAVALDAYRVGEGVAWRRLMEIAFELTADPAELHELLDVCSRSVSSFVDETLAGIAAQIELERDELTRGSHAERRETVSLILDGAPISRQRAESRLGYALNRPHTAAVIWGDTSGSGLGDVDRAAEAFGRCAGSGRPLSILASTASRWVWVPGAEGVDGDQLVRAIDDIPAVRVAVGPTATGVDGFRRSHLDAVTAQRMLARLGSRQRVAFFGDIHLVALLTQDPERADEFITRVLGEFEFADDVLQDTVRTFVMAQCNASRAAADLYLHRNTLLRRLARANELLPRPLSQTSVEVAVALEAAHWRGPRATG